MCGFVFGSISYNFLLSSSLLTKDEFSFLYSLRQQQLNLHRQRANLAVLQEHSDLLRRISRALHSAPSSSSSSSASPSSSCSSSVRSPSPSQTRKSWLVESRHGALLRGRQARLWAVDQALRVSYKAGEKESRRRRLESSTYLLSFPLTYGRSLFEKLSSGLSPPPQSNFRFFLEDSSDSPASPLRSAGSSVGSLLRGLWRPPPPASLPGRRKEVFEGKASAQPVQKEALVTDEKSLRERTSSCSSSSSSCCGRSDNRPTSATEKRAESIFRDGEGKRDEKERRRCPSRSYLYTRRLQVFASDQLSLRLRVGWRVGLAFMVFYGK